jgi:competence protein ComEA
MVELTIRQKLAALVVVIVLALGGIVLYFSREHGGGREFRATAVAGGASIFVHVCGAVKRPGVLKLAVGIRAFEALQKAGGALSEADLNRVNLAALVVDGEQLYVPRKGEVLETKSKTRRTSKPKSSPKPKSLTGLKAGVPVLTVAATPTPTTIPWPLDLNAVTREELDAIPGIGPSLAERILQYRTEHGRFTVYEDLKNVKGIGPVMLERLRAYLALK